MKLFDKGRHAYSVHALESSTPSRGIANFMLYSACPFLAVFLRKPKESEATSSSES